MRALAVATALAAVTSRARAADDTTSAPEEHHAVTPTTHLVTTGLDRVRVATVEEILPRRLPAVVTDDELRELERRLWALAIFDEVAVRREGDAVHVTVREKWTLVPGVDFGTSRTLADSYAYLSLTEVNLAGRAQELGAYVAYAERAISSEVWWAEHPNASRRASFEAGAFWFGSGFRFDGEPYTWERRRSGGRFGVRLPFPYGTRLRWGIASAAYRETLDGDVPRGLADGVGGSLGLRATWDAYAWHDIVPSGLRVTVEALPGLFARDGRLTSRHHVMAQALAAIPLSRKMVVAVNVVGEAVSPGDVNHSALVGNVPGFRFSVGAIGGVRGLPDNVYRDAAHAYGDLELRHALTFAPRWHLQGVLFVDGGALATMNARGDVERARLALSTGGGLRLVPTAIASFVLRVDAGRLLAPTPATFWTFGFSQYFF